MFRTATAIAVAALFCAPAMAQTVTTGQYKGVTQYTGLTDFSGACVGQAGLAVGQLTTSVSTVTGLGAVWTSTLANTNPTPTSMFGTGWINCHFPALPAASSFTAVPTIGGYTASPTTTDVTTCTASNGIQYTLTSSNGTSTGPGGAAQTETITLLPPNGTGADSGYKLTTTNTLLSVGTTPLCYLSTDALYLLAN